MTPNDPYSALPPPIQDMARDADRASRRATFVSGLVIGVIGLGLATFVFGYAALHGRALMPRGEEIVPILEADGQRAKVARLLEQCVRKHVHDVNGDDPTARADMLSRVNLDNPALLALPTPRGLRFGATGYAPPARVLEGQGPVLTWAALAREGVLRPGGIGNDVLALTRGASTPGDEPCALAE